VGDYERDELSAHERGEKFELILADDLAITRMRIGLIGFERPLVFGEHALVA
jgi:hypothetical protein